MTKIVLTGANGRMGSTLARLAKEDSELALMALADRHGQAPVYPDLAAALNVAPADVVIDFTSPEASLMHAEICAARKVAMVIGTTGFEPNARERLAELGRKVPMVVAPNTSVGVNVVIQMAARLAQALGSAYDVEIVEAHHKMKKDAPSGTALKLGEEICRATGRPLDVLRYERHGAIGERRPGEIGIQSIRGGDVVGEHTVFFLGNGERIELTHKATHRDQFGLGALRAAKWVKGQAPGIYGMADVLGLRAA